ncbi:MAG: hypothetical protein KF690_01855 [Bacteroidetes bacterium]|nr:hypothetical protein [Bacteroidota bacterium]
MNPNYASPGPDMLACPACDTNVLACPQPVSLFVHQAQGLSLLYLGDKTLALNEQLAHQLAALLSAGDYDVQSDTCLLLAGQLKCPVCNHHSDWQLQRREEDLLYSRYRLQFVDTDTAPHTGQQLLAQDLHAAQVYAIDVLPDDADKDLSRISSLEMLFAAMEVHTLRHLVQARHMPFYTHYYAQSLVPLPAPH